MTVTRIIVGVLSFLTLLSGGPLAASAEEPLRTRTYYIDFKPTLVPDKRVEEIVIRELLSQGAYRIVRNVRPPFRLLTPEADLVVSNNELKVKAEFAPITSGGFTDDLLLERIGPPPSDTLRIRMTATSYFIDRKESLEFGRVAVGDSVKRRLYIRKDNTGEQTWIVDPPTRPTPPFSLRTLSPQNIPTTDTSFFLFSFSPLAVGVYHDTVNLVRMNKGIALDTIRVYLSGIGYDLDTVVQLNLGTVVTADSVARKRTFYKPLAHLYRVQHKPDAESGFSLQMSEKIDSVMAVVSFIPQHTGLHKDSIILERVGEIQSPTPFDRIVIYVSGNGIGMEPTAKVEFKDVVVNDVVKEPLVLHLGATPQTMLFGYELVQVDAGPVTGMIVDPTQLSKSSEISLEFTCAPTVFASSTQMFLLIRSSEGREPVDTTSITVTTLMIPRPVSLSISMEEDTTRVRIADTATLRVIIHAEGDIDEPLFVRSVSGRIKYNATVIVPQVSDEWVRMVDGDNIFVQYNTDNSNVRIEGPTTVLAELKIIGVLGDADKSVLDLDEWSVNINSNRKDVATTDALVELTNVWRYQNGSGRFVNSLQGALGLEIDPNPVVGTSTLRVSNVPASVGELVIVDIAGNLITDLTTDLRSGTREFPITKGTGSSLSLSPGSYYARLLVRGPNGESVNSVARLFVVQ